jgi:hypothetical protein
MISFALLTPEEDFSKLVIPNSIIFYATYFSDHCQLVTHLNCNLNIVDQHDDYVKHEFAFQWTRLSKMLLEKELSEKNVYELTILYPVNFKFYPEIF